ncbi:hypothetical protein HGRIS_002751 [Hohenbuehelia grisea]|uniref:Uncharacterized protein n=1 Tax=Hohenbuehelia grisea TaxID=104357 RepID=A0ABR3JM56_9AGAR
MVSESAARHHGRAGKDQDASGPTLPEVIRYGTLQRMLWDTETDALSIECLPAYSKRLLRASFEPGGQFRRMVTTDSKLEAWFRALTTRG